MDKNTNTPPETSPIMIPCFFVIHSATGKKLDVYAFSSGEDAKKSIADDVHTIKQAMTMRGTEPNSIINQSGNASLFVPDTDFFHAWMLSEGTISCHSSLQAPAPILGDPKSNTKDCFIVTDYSYENGTSVYAFDTKEAAAESISGAANYMGEGLRMQGYQPEICIEGGVMAQVSVPGTNIRFEWQIIKSSICVKYKEPIVRCQSTEDISPILSSESPNVPSPAPQSSTTEKMVTELCSHCGTEVTMQWDTATMGFSAFCPHCGETLMLCNECRHAPDSSVCDYNEEGFCHRCTPDRKVPSAMATMTPLGSIIVRGGYGKGPGVFVDLRRPDADQDMPLVYVGFSPKTESGQNCIEALISGEGRKSQGNERVVFDGVEDYFRTDDSDYIVLITPTQAVSMIADLGNGQPTDTGDRTSQYFTIAKGRYALEKTVKVSLIENKEGLAEDSQYYSLHMIDEVSGGPCKWFNSDLNEDALEQLLKNILDGLEGVNYTP